MNYRPKISVIIPCYNLGNYLTSCLDSIQWQNNIDVEYIFVNDGSTDETLDTLREFCAKRANYILIDQENAGVSKARNTAMEIARGDYIYLLDGDDILTDHAIERMVSCIEANSPDVILSSVIVAEENKQLHIPLKLKFGNYDPEALYKSCRYFPTMPKLLYRRAIIEQYGLRFNPNLRVGEVYDFSIRVMAVSSKVAVVEQSFFIYVMRPLSATHKPNFNVDVTVLDTVKDYYKWGGELKKYSSFHTTAFKMLMSFTYNKYVRGGFCDQESCKVIETVLEDEMAKNCIRNVALSVSIPVKTRILAIYVLLFGKLGFRILCNIFKRV